MTTLCTYLGFCSGAAVGFMAGFLVVGGIALVLLNRSSDRP